MPGPAPGRAQARSVAAIFATKTRDEWIAFAAERDCCLEPVLAPDERRGRSAPRRARSVLRDRLAARARSRSSARRSRPRDTAFAPRAAAGEHTRAVLRDAGFSDAEIDALIARGAAREARRARACSGAAANAALGSDLLQLVDELPVGDEVLLRSSDSSAANIASQRTLVPRISLASAPCDDRAQRGDEIARGEPCDSSAVGGGAARTARRPGRGAAARCCGCGCCGWACARAA